MIIELVDNTHSCKTPLFNDNGHDPKPSYLMESNTLLGHTFPNSSLSHCHWLMLRNLAYHLSSPIRELPLWEIFPF
jgi:hypothetical protein